ncbi:hypothetical protein [Cellulomonas oligotrophica]|uniref:Uncharacterized protein n=1 Tax=Cellulomonas oligotrophica TaxID=931536 RepID=A0A7Y9JZ97_9CELL|nr:hypothetical protein [Cellulomonas oligotrophica]NYD87647.1 hypothetical protein [Cellulomonas oligotrophica]GIG33524.1 hypothetical protein Col01nite_26830 [Cellulomonas oligotrophica]
MRKRLLYAAIGVVGLVLAALGVASATVWRADDVLVATATADEHTVITDAGVLEMAGDAVTVRATAGSADPVTLVVGRDTDVLGWVGEDPHQRVSGLDGWHELQLDAPAADPTDAATAAAATDGATGAATAEATQPPAEDATADADDAADGEAADGEATDEPTAVDPAGSDMWVLEATGEGSAELEWTVQAEGRWSVMAVSTGATPPTISLAWPQTVTTPWLWPAAGAGALLVALSLLLLMRDVLRARRGDGSGWTAVATGSTPVVEAGAVPAGLTRRQMRELQGGGRPGTQSLPVVPTVVRAAPEPVVVPGRGGTGSSAPDRAGASDAPTPDSSPAGGRRSRRGSGQGDAPPRRPGLRSLGRRDAAPEQPAPATAAAPSASAGASSPHGAAGAPSSPPWRGEDRVPSPPGAPTGAAGPRPAWLADRGPAPSPGPAHPSAPAPGDQAAGRGQGPTTSAWGPRPSAPPQGPAGAGPTRGPGPTAPGRAVPPRPGAPVGTVPPAGPGQSGGRHPGGPAGPGASAGPAGSQARPGWAPSPPSPSPSGRGPRPDAGGPPEGGRPRPAWARGDDGDAGSRADAWRRAWGMPPVPGEDDTREEDR